MSRPIIFGEIEGIEEGDWFKGRKDEDLGDEIIYTGAGGNDSNTNKQIEDQSWENNGNAGLLKSMNEGLPVRVIRGYQHKSEFSPKSGYSYAGLYSVIDSWEQTGKSGYKICRFKLVYCGINIERKFIEEIELDHSVREKKRKLGTVLRVLRDSKIAKDVKNLYNFECQVCGFIIKVKNSFYAEGAHIRPLGKPHNGDDSLANILCLCPNHHVMLDKGCFSITDDYTLIGDVTGVLNVHNKHKIDKKNLAYHRKIHGYD